MEHNGENNTFPLIQRFPVELLAKIFLLCVSIQSPPIIQIFAEPPVSLCHVCKSWREVALDLSRLWTALSVDLDALAAGAAGNKMLSHSVQRWFGRASYHPLTLKFKFSGNQGKRLDKAFNDFIAPFAHRLRHLDLAAWIHQKLWSDLQFPALEAIIIRDTLEVYEDDEFTPLFPSAPCLQRVRVDSCLLSGRGGPAKLVLPWIQLTHLFIDYTLEVEEWQEMLRMCLNLQHGVFSLSGSWPPEESPASEQCVVLNHLVELAISIFSFIDFTMLSPFKLPALTTLRLESDLEDDEDAWTEAVHSRFFQHSLPLRRLSLSCPWALKIPNLILLLKAAPHVVELDLQIDTRYQDIFSILQCDQTTGRLVPNLKILIVELTPTGWLRADSLEVKIISHVVQSRMHTNSSNEEGNRLEKLVLLLGGDPEAERAVAQLTAELQPFVDDGLHLELKATTSIHSSERLDQATTKWHEGLV